ncbi:MAG: LON peptidase substrate-binding domain-containing protein [Chloroflexota bacterium]
MIESHLMYELPLFPLNTVLFPGTPLQLHIFEERYKRMINLCIDQRQPFGVVLIRRGVEALGPLAETYPVGCAAQIVHVQRLAQERLNIVAVGQKRFRIVSVDQERQPYLLGTVENLPLEDIPEEQIEQQAGALRPLLVRFIRALMEAGGGQFDLQQMPGNPVSLAYVAAALLQIPPACKQALLEINRADELLDNLQFTFRKENALLKAILSEQDVLQSGGFSVN